MNRNVLIAILFAIPSLAQAETADDFGTWAEVGVEKSLSKQWSLGLETEYRSQQKQRFGVGLNASYKPLKNLKLGAFYTYLHTQKPESVERHYRKDIEDDEHWNGYNVKEEKWTPRHRAGVDATGSVKLWSWLRISLRERYQMTYSPVSHRDETKYRFDAFTDPDTGKLYSLPIDADEDGKPDYPITETDSKDSETNQVLRSRLKLEVDKKKWHIAPFISAEAHNDLSNHMSLEKIRSSVGLEYKMNKHNEISVSYILTVSFSDEATGGSSRDNRMHALGLGYNYKF